MYALIGVFVLLFSVHISERLDNKNIVMFRGWFWLIGLGTGLIMGILYGIQFYKWF